MIESILFGFIAGSALLIGGLIGVFLRLSKKTIAVIMAFGSGVLICALSFELMEEAYFKGGFIPVTFGFLIGALLFMLGDYLVTKKGGRYHRNINKNNIQKKQKIEGSGMSIFIGTLIDGISESIAIGVSLVAGQSFGILMLVAVFLNNLPESISASADMLKVKKSKKFILILWSGVVLIYMIGSFLGYTLLANAPGELVGLVLAIAAGAILATITNTMIPEAFEEGGKVVALSTVVGFLVTFIISKIAK